MATCWFYKSNLVDVQVRDQADQFDRKDRVCVVALPPSSEVQRSFGWLLFGRIERRRLAVRRRKRNLAMVRARGIIG